jgi:hypothetical protein
VKPMIPAGITEFVRANQTRIDTGHAPLLR